MEGKLWNLSEIRKKKILGEEWRLLEKELVCWFRCLMGSIGDCRVGWRKLCFWMWVAFASQIGENESCSLTSFFFSFLSLFDSSHSITSMNIKKEKMPYVKLRINRGMRMMNLLDLSTSHLLIHTPTPFGLFKFQVFSFGFKLQRSIQCFHSTYDPSNSPDIIKSCHTFWVSLFNPFQRIARSLIL